MTQEEKAKAYDEALALAKRLISNNCTEVEKLCLKCVFPELKESEDERIRKSLVEFLTEIKDISESGRTSWAIREKDAEMCKSFLDYLEKQKEQSITANDLDEEIHRFFDDCIEVHDAKIYGVDERVITVDCYEITARHFAKWGEKQKELKPAEFTHHETNKSLKDVVTHQMEYDGDIDDFVRKGIDDVVLKYAKLGAKWQKEHKPVDFPTVDEEVNEFLETHPKVEVPEKYKTPDFVFKKKEYESHPIISKDATSVKSAEWSEEDKDMLNCCISSIEEAKENRYAYKETDGDTSYDREIDWLKSLSLNLKKKNEDVAKLCSNEWSNEDEQRIAEIEFAVMQMNTKRVDTKDKCLAWLKSLRPQQKVEWSKEDENALKYIHELIGWGYSEKFMDAQTAHDMRKWVNEHLGPDTFQNGNSHWKPSEDEVRLINTSISFLKDFANKGYENAVECIDWLKSKLNGNTCK